MPVLIASVSRHIDKSRAALHFTERSGNRNLAARHYESVLAVALVSKNDLLAVLVGDGQPAQLIALIRGNSQGDGRALDSTRLVSGQLAVRRSRHGYRITADGRVAGAVMTGGRLILHKDNIMLAVTSTTPYAASLTALFATSVEPLLSSTCSTRTSLPVRF